MANLERNQPDQPSIGIDHNRIVDALSGTRNGLISIKDANGNYTMKNGALVASPNTGTGIPHLPTGLTLTQNTINVNGFPVHQIYVSWASNNIANPTDNVVSYSILYRKQADTNYTTVVVLEPNVSTTITGVVVGYTYSVSIQAVNNINQVSGYTVESNITINNDYTPSIPASVAVFQGTDNVNGFPNHWAEVTWTANSAGEYIDRYEVKWRIVGDTNYHYANCTGNLVKVMDLSPSTQYAFTVQAINNQGTPSGFSLPFNITIGTDASPAIPAGFSIVQSSDNVNGFPLHYVVASWTANAAGDFVDRYELRYRKTGGANYFLVNAKSISAQVDSLLPSTSYSFSVQAINNQGYASGFTAESSVTIAADGVPSIPTGFSLVQGTDNVNGFPDHWVEALWTANSAGEFVNRYEVKYRKSGDTLYLADSTKGTLVKETGLLPGTVYSFSVQAVNNQGSPSGFTVESNITIGSDATPAVPAGLALTEVVDPNGGFPIHSVVATWTANAAGDFVDRYELRYRKTSTTDYYVATSKNLSFKVSPLLAGTVYYFSVQAVNNQGYASGFSADVTATLASDPAPAIPTGLAVAQGTDNVNGYPSHFLNPSWTANAAGDYVDRYEVRWRISADTVYNYVNSKAISAKIYGVLPTNSYGVSVQAINNQGTPSGYSSEVTVTVTGDVLPLIPTGLVLTSGIDLLGQTNNGYISAKWTANAANDYVADYEATCYTRTILSASLTNGTAYTTVVLTTGAPFPMQVGTILFLDNGTSAQTVSVSTAVVTGNTTINVTSFTANANYSNTNTFVLMGGITQNTGNTFSKWTGLLPGAFYYVKLRAQNNQGSFSAGYITASLLLSLDSIPPGTPTGLVAYAAPHGAFLQWSANSEADLQGYLVQYLISGAATTGTSTAVSASTMTDGVAAWTVNAYAGSWVTSGSSTALVASNTATVLTLTQQVGGIYWLGGTPATGAYDISAWTLINTGATLNTSMQWTNPATPNTSNSNVSTKFRISAIDWTGNISGYTSSVSQTTGGLSFAEMLVGNITVLGTFTGSGGISTAGVGSTGARVMMETAGIRAYNSGNTRTFFLDATTGNLDLTGNVVAGGTVQGAALQGGSLRIPQSGSPYTQIDSTGLKFYSITDTGSGGTVTYTATSLTDTSKAWGVNAYAGLQVVSGSVNTFVVSNTSTVLTLSPVWSGTTPSAGASYTIGGLIMSALTAAPGTFAVTGGTITGPNIIGGAIQTASGVGSGSTVGVLLNSSGAGFYSNGANGQANFYGYDSITGQVFRNGGQIYARSPSGGAIDLHISAGGGSTIFDTGGSSTITLRAITSVKLAGNATQSFYGLVFDQNQGGLSAPTDLFCGAGTGTENYMARRVTFAWTGLTYAASDLHYPMRFKTAPTGVTLTVVANFNGGTITVDQIDDLGARVLSTNASAAGSYIARWTTVGGSS